MVDISEDACFNKCLQNENRVQCINWPLLFRSTIALCVFVVEFQCDLKLLTAPDAYIAISSHWLSLSLKFVWMDTACLPSLDIRAHAHLGTVRAHFLILNVLQYNHSLRSLHSKYRCIGWAEHRDVSTL